MGDDERATSLLALMRSASARTRRREADDYRDSILVTIAAAAKDDDPRLPAVGVSCDSSRRRRLLSRCAHSFISTIDSGGDRDAHDRRAASKLATTSGERVGDDDERALLDSCKSDLMVKIRLALSDGF